MDPTPPPVSVAGRTVSVRERHLASVPVWSEADFPSFELALGDFVHVIAVDGRQLLVKRALAEAWGRCGQVPQVWPEPFSRAELLLSWLVFFLAGAALATGILKEWFL